MFLTKEKFGTIIQAMSPDQITTIIERFGGRAAIAAAVGVSVKAVEMAERRGRFSARWHLPLLRHAEERGIALTPSDLMAAPAKPKRARKRKAA